MLALYRSGRQAEALAAYRNARQTLVDELGIEPGAALQQLEKQILLQDEALDAPRRLKRTNLPLAIGPLLGRETELARIDELVARRSPIHLAAELDLAVEPLAGDAAAELFSLRAAAVGCSVAPDATIVEICRRLDNLPLADELAAARAKLLPPSAILERLEK